jgi:hypothetical protein
MRWLSFSRAFCSALIALACGGGGGGESGSSDAPEPPGLVEFGPNDFPISDMGPDGDVNFAASSGTSWGNVAVAYNSDADEYLVVWNGDDGSGTQVDEEFEIYGQRLDAVTGAEVGANDFRISDMGPDRDVSFEAGHPELPPNPRADEYLVVWEGDDDTGTLVDDEFEIFGQLLSVPEP